MRCMLLAVTVLLTAAFPVRSAAQDTPLVSGGVGVVSTTDGGRVLVQPVIAPVAVVPIGSRIMIESRADLRGIIQRENSTGPYGGEFFAGLEYLQLDYIASSKLTLTVGKFLTPFGTFNERLAPIWIRNFHETPLIFPIGTRTSGSSDGAMVRGVAVSRHAVELNYAAYFSASSTVKQFESGRAAGGRAGIYVPDKRLDVGFSYQRFLQARHMNLAGLYLWWQSGSVPLQIKSEYAHAPHGHGYWVEAAYRLSKDAGANTWWGRMQPMVRVQQLFSSPLAVESSLPPSDRKQTDVGMNYYFPGDVRLSTSYARQFASAGNRNIWNIALVYRFLLPMFPEKL